MKLTLKLLPLISLLLLAGIAEGNSASVNWGSDLYDTAQSVAVDADTNSPDTDSDPAISVSAASLSADCDCSSSLTKDFNVRSSREHTYQARAPPL